MQALRAMLQTDYKTISGKRLPVCPCFDRRILQRYNAPRTSLAAGPCACIETTDDTDNTGLSSAIIREIRVIRC